MTMCNRQNLNHFEMKSRKPGQNGQSNNSNNGNGNNNNSNSSSSNPSYNNQNSMGNSRSYGNQPGQALLSGSSRPPLLPGRPGTGLTGRPNNGPLLSSQPRLPQLPHQQLPFGGANPQWSQLMQNGPRNNQLHGSGPGLNPMMRMPQGNSRSLTNQPLLSAPNQGDFRLSQGSQFLLYLLFQCFFVKSNHFFLSPYSWTWWCWTTCVEC